MYKYVGIIPVILALVAQTVFLPGLALYMEANRAVLAAPYCINKDKPMLNCNGNCVLARRLGEAMQQPQSSGTESETILLSFGLSLYYEEAAVWQLSALPTPMTMASPSVPHPHGREFRGAIFRPPPRSTQA